MRVLPFSSFRHLVIWLVVWTYGISGTQILASRVIIRAEASVDFVQKQTGTDQDKVISYHLVPGKRYGGYARDNSLSRVSFLEIAQVLAKELQKKKYLPSAKIEDNEVMLLVSWGVTAVEDSMEEFLGLNSPEEYDQMFGSPSIAQNADGEFETINEPSTSPNWGAVGKRQTAKMLGFWDVLQGNSLMPSEHHELQSLLDEERYFIIVTAFDNQKYQKGATEVLWTTRFSMRAAGIGFNQAYVDMTLGASEFFGKHSDGLERRRVDEQQSKVEIGDIEVIDTVDSEEGGQ